MFVLFSVFWKTDRPCGFYSNVKPFYLERKNYPTMMKTLHRIRYDINIYFANFQAWVIIGFLEMGIFMRVPDQFMWPWPTWLGSDTHQRQPVLGCPTIELQDFSCLALPYLFLFPGSSIIINTAFYTPKYLHRILPKSAELLINIPRKHSYDLHW